MMATEPEGRWRQPSPRPRRHLAGLVLALTLACARVCPAAVSCSPVDVTAQKYKLLAAVERIEIGGLTPKQFRQGDPTDRASDSTPFDAEGALSADIDNDGLCDVVVFTLLPPDEDSYTRRSTNVAFLFKRLANGRFAQIGDVVPARKVSIYQAPGHAAPYLIFTAFKRERLDDDLPQGHYLIMSKPDPRAAWLTVERDSCEADLREWKKENPAAKTVDGAFECKNIREAFADADRRIAIPENPQPDKIK